MAKTKKTKKAVKATETIDAPEVTEPEFVDEPEPIDETEPDVDEEPEIINLTYTLSVETEPQGIPCRKCGHLITRPFGVIKNGKQRRVCRNTRCLCTFWADHRKGYVYPKHSCCPECGSDNTLQYSTKPGQQYRECRACKHKYTETGHLI